MKCGLASLRWAHAFLAAYVALIGVLLFLPLVAHAAQVPPLIDIPSITVMENAGSAPVVIVKAKANSYSKINVQTVDGTAKAGIDYTAINQTVTLANNATSTRLPIPIIDNAAYQGARTFSLKLTILRFGQVPASYTPITVTINDDEAAPAPAPAPTGLAGETPIADNFDGTAGLEPQQGIAPVETNPMLGAFRLFCGPGQLLRDDPLVLPGQPGASHLHQFIGNTGTNASSNYQSLRTTGGTTCGQSSTPFNRTAIWFPAMLDGVGHVVKPDFSGFYYKRNAAKDPMCSLANTPHLGQCVDLPNGLRFVFGYNMKTGVNPDPAVVFSCWDSEDGTVSRGTATGYYHSIAEVAAANCPVGAQLVITPNAPNCWDGVNLDSADHRSHMSYATGPYTSPQQFPACPTDHPYVIPDPELVIHFTIDANLKTWHLSSDEMVPGAVAGSTFHVDYWEAWSPTVKKAWHDGCINGAESCGGAALGNEIGKAITGGDVPNGGFPKHQLVPVP